MQLNATLNRSPPFNVYDTVFDEIVYYLTQQC